MENVNPLNQSMTLKVELNQELKITTALFHGVVMFFTSNTSITFQKR